MVSHTAVSAPLLRQEVVATVGALRGALRELLAGLPPAESAAGLSRLLGIDYATSWKLTRIAGEEGLLDVAVDVPRPGSLAKLVASSAALGVAGPVIGRVVEVAEGFEALAARHGGERAIFDAMLVSLNPRAVPKVQLASKRQAYRANTCLFGIQSDTFFVCLIAPPTMRGATASPRLALTGHRGLKRFDPRARLTAFSLGFNAEWGLRPPRPGSERGVPTGLAAADEHESVLLPEFGSVPAPPMRCETNPISGRLEYVFEHDSIGLSSAVDFVTASIYSIEHAKAPLDPRRHVISGAGIDFPSGTLLLDMFVHGSILAGRGASCRVTASAGVALRDAIAHPEHCNWMPAQEEAEVLGFGPETARCREFPRYGALLRYVFAHRPLGDAAEYALVRCKVAYPVVGSSIVQRLADEAGAH